MPELPDLLYIQKYLRSHVVGKTVTTVGATRTVILRIASSKSLQQLVVGTSIESVRNHGPFLCFCLKNETEVIVNLMLAGKLQHQRNGEKREAHCCFWLGLDDMSRLNVCDPELMAKVYVLDRRDHKLIPRFDTQGVDILSGLFTLARFLSLAKQHSRKQVRVFLNDQTILSAIGNAYADEILFDARVHPKTFVGKLSPDDLSELYRSIPRIIHWGMKEVEKAGQPIHVKVRDHLKVRNRKGEPCPRCGAKIRREGVRGYDVFFCPVCQPATRQHFLDWTKVS
jgi:formamidopyrimidine-DNA glycosylase